MAGSYHIAPGGLQGMLYSGLEQN